jgi:hypothetical protein
VVAGTHTKYPSPKGQALIFNWPVNVNVKSAGEVLYTACRMSWLMFLICFHGGFRLEAKVRNIIRYTREGGGGGQWKGRTAGAGAVGVIWS